MVSLDDVVDTLKLIDDSVDDCCPQTSCELNSPTDCR